MTTLKEIEERLKAYVPVKGNGDNLLDPHIETPKPARDAAVLVLLIPQDDGSFNIIFTERTKTLHAHAGQISFPGGGVEATDADDIETALREASEEIGLDPKNARVIGQLDEYITRTGFRITPIVAVLEKGQTWTPQPEEVARIFEVPVDFIAKNMGQETMTFEHGERRFYAVTYEESHIWGATAGILKNFTDVALKDPTPPAPAIAPPHKKSDSPFSRK